MCHDHIVLDVTFSQSHMSVLCFDSSLLSVDGSLLCLDRSLLCVDRSFLCIKGLFFKSSTRIITIAHDTTP